MKRGWRILVCLSFIFILSFAFVSAGLFNKNKITGNAILGDRMIIDPKGNSGDYILVSKYYAGSYPGYDDYTNYAGTYCQKVQNCSGFDSSSVVVKDDSVKACRCDNYWGCPYNGTGGKPLSCVEDVSASPYWERVGSVTCTGCAPQRPVCGNGIQDVGEQCDRTSWAVSASCQYFGYTSGVLGCKNDCTFDFSSCVQNSTFKKIFVGETKPVELSGVVYNVKLDGLSSNAIVSASITINGQTNLFTQGQTKTYSINGVNMDVYAKTIMRTGDNGSGYVEFSIILLSTCTDTCSSLGYQCGTKSVCGAATNCGTCYMPDTCNSMGQCVSSNQTFKKIFVGETKPVELSGVFYNVKLNGLSSDAVASASITINGQTKTFTQGQTKTYSINNVNLDVYAKTIMRTGDNGSGYVEFSLTSSLVCTDSDGGINYDIKGDVTTYLGNGSQILIDFCETSDILNESYCEGNSPKTLIRDCGMENKICSNGACVKGPIPPNQPNQTCTDTCSSLGYQCGTKSVCGVATNCGTCASGYNCSNGACTRVVIPGGESCDLGCSFNGKCYPFGYRRAGMYCSDNYTFVRQLSSNFACENNFECTTNLCIDDSCISRNLIQRILNWFRRN